jgi:hypothetical protein
VDNACSRSLARRDVFYREALNELLQLLFGNRFVVRIAACDVGIIQKSSSRRRCLAMALTMTSTSSVGPVSPTVVCCPWKMAELPSNGKITRTVNSLQR